MEKGPLELLYFAYRRAEVFSQPFSCLERFGCVIRVPRQDWRAKNLLSFFCDDNN